MEQGGAEEAALVEINIQSKINTQLDLKTGDVTTTALIFN